MAGTVLPRRNPQLEEKVDADGQTVLRHRRNRWKATLNETAAQIWRSCDGKTTVAAMSRSLRETSELGPEEAEAVTRRGLADLIQAGLVISESAAATLHALSRRQILKLLGLAGLSATFFPKVVRAGVIDGSGATAFDEAYREEAIGGERATVVLGSITSTGVSFMTTTDFPHSTTTTTTTTENPIFEDGFETGDTSNWVNRRDGSL